ncbi:MAG: hypothetical protein ACSHX0_04220 [Akkermansiaceae bacterium]
MKKVFLNLVVICVFLSGVGHASVVTEMLIYERDGLLHDTDEKKDDGFFLDQPPLKNGNWVTPVNFRDGQLHFKILIRSCPTKIPNMTVKWNIWQDEGAENWTSVFACPAVPGSSVEFVSNTHVGLGQKKTPLDFTIPRKMYGLHFLLNEREGLKGPGLIKWHKWGREKYTREEIFPMDVKIMVVAVAKDATFSGWENYWKEDTLEVPNLVDSQKDAVGNLSKIPVTKDLVLDLDADAGVVLEDENRVTIWTNQAPNPKAIDFKHTEEGRTKTIISQKELGTGRPTLKINTTEINGHNSLVFRENELINDNDEAFHGMMTGGGYTWFAVIKPYEQGGPGKMNSKYPSAFFGCLRSSNVPQNESGLYAGFWGSFYPDGRIYMGSRNGMGQKVRDPVNTPEVEAPAPAVNKWHIVMGRQGSGQGVVKLELFVNDSTDAVNSHDYPVGDVEPSRMAIGTERNAINHQGKESFDGELARLLMYETALNEQDMKRVFDYLRTLYFQEL